ncbi:MAG TPA: glycine cleavage system protein GcvH [Chromatiaceae bacterium]|nr:glycine cleavage system protein GcvH [Chromatiaceae bacterium]
MYPVDLKYLDSHQWLKVEGEVGTIGITDYGQKEMGEILYVELPRKGERIKQKETFSTLESVKAAFDVPSPVSGEIVEVNEKLEDDPSLVNRDPYGSGWLVKVKISDFSELDSLLTSQQYENLIKSKGEVSEEKGGG